MGERIFKLQIKGAQEDTGAMECTHSLTQTTQLLIHRDNTNALTHTHTTHTPSYSHTLSHTTHIPSYSRTQKENTNPGTFVWHVALLCHTQ